MVRDHPDELEADFAHYYPNEDFLDIYRPGVGMTLRRAAVLTINLPPGSMFWRAYGGPQAWSDEVTALVGVRHKLDVLAWQNANQGKTSGFTPQPKIEEPPPYAADERAAHARMEAKALRTIARMRQREEQQHSE